jgi:predicted acyl esterase
VATAALAAAACAPPGPSGPPLDPPAPLVRAGIEQLYVTGTAPGEEVRVTGPLADPAPATVTGRTDAAGSLAVRELRQGSTYRVEVPGAGVDRTVRVLVADEHPGQSFYDATTLREGLNYLPMRDGTLLAAVVRPPVGQSLGNGPFPTVVEYSGYQIAAPRDPIYDQVGRLLGIVSGNDPLLPGGETSLGSQLVRFAGYATVSVQLRGSGCSGGEADLFDLPSAADGYDTIETVAAQDWVLGGRVGMVGISFSGFSQLATAATKPPSLAAIAPFSFAGRLWDVGWPGGIRNVGFAEGWLSERQRNAEPAPGPGALPYANALVGSDEYCRRNQELRLQTRDAVGLFRQQTTRTELYDRRDFEESLARIEVPVYGALQYQDEQTGAAVIAGLDRLTPRNPRVWMELSSGRHVDSVSPDTLVDLFQFLDLYVARRSPELKLGLYLIQGQVFGGGAAPLPWPSLFGLPYDEALRRWEAQPTFRYGFERARGGSSDATGVRWSFRSPTFPPAGTVVQRWHAGPGGTLTTGVPDAGEVSYRSDPTARPAGSRPWTAVPAGTGVGFSSAPLERTTTVVGPVAADLWVRSTAADTDLQVTLTEVRPDGTEQLVATGALRASHRRVDPARDAPLEPGLTFTDPEPLGSAAELVRVPVSPVGHTFRAGSRIRVVVGPVGGDKESWRFGAVDATTRPTNTLVLGGATPTSVLLPVVDAPGVPAGLPTCPLEGQPCRTYVPASNGG